MKTARIILLYLAAILVGFSLGYLAFKFTYKAPVPKVTPPLSSSIPSSTTLPSTQATSSASISAQVDHPVKKFTITASNYKFFPNEIRVKNGDKVQISLRVITGLHNISIPAYGTFSPQISDNQTTPVEFIADEKGTFPIYCDVEDHQQRGMTGKLIVE